MKKKKKIIVGLCIIFVLFLVVVGIIFAIKKTTGKTVTVIPVSDINLGYWGNDVNISGTVTSNASQEIHLNDKQIVDQVYVKEGDVVEVGTPLLSFDLTMTSLNLESEKLNKEGLEIQKNGLEGEIKRLKKETPISSTGHTPTAYAAGQNHSSNFMTLSVDTGTTSPTDNTGVAPQPTPTPEKPPITLPAYDCIDENSQYQGIGTTEDPRCYLAKNTDDYTVRITGKFLNEAKSNQICFCIALHQEDVIAGELIASISINGARLKEYEDSKTYVVTLYPVDDIIAEPPTESDVPEIPEESEIPDEGPGEEISIPEGYTREELDTMIREKQSELRNLNLDIRECELRIAQIEKSLNDQEIKSTVNGIVKSVGDPEKGEVNGQAFLVVESTEGLYVQGSISELMLGQIKVGHILNGTSWETGMMFEAEIRDISPYPIDGNNYDGYGNSNVSYYPFTAYIETGDGLKNNEYVGFTTTIGTDETGESVYTEKMFVREENGVSYVYIADENNRLKKQEVKIKNIDGYTVEILSGLTNDDRITFPYGKNVKAGALVKDGTVDDLYR